MERGVPEDVQHDYGGRCWWCGAVADSREHRYKRSDLSREFGPGPWHDEDAVVRMVGGKPVPVQGPNSKHAKFEKNLCANCNNARSQPFDLAYDKLMEYLRTHEDRIVSDRSFELSHVYGAGWPAQRKLLERYIVKYICCRLAEDRVKIPVETVSYLADLSQPYSPYLTLEFEIRLDVYDLLKRMGEDGFTGGSLWKGDMLIKFSDSRRVITHAESFYGYRWLRINYHLDTQNPKGGNNFRGDKVRLPADRNVSFQAMLSHMRTVREQKGPPPNARTVDLADE